MRKWMWILVVLFLLGTGACSFSEAAGNLFSKPTPTPKYDILNMSEEERQSIISTRQAEIGIRDSPEVDDVPETDFIETAEPNVTDLDCSSKLTGKTSLIQDKIKVSVSVIPVNLPQSQNFVQGVHTVYFSISRQDAEQLEGLVNNTCDSLCKQVKQCVIEEAKHVLGKESQQKMEKFKCTPDYKYIWWRGERTENWPNSYFYFYYDTVPQLTFVAAIDVMYDCPLAPPD